MIISIVTGTRPQIIKSAPLLHALRNEGMEVRFIHTGQHYDYELAAQFIDEFDIQKPDKNLGVGSGSNAYQTYEVISSLERELDRERPDYLVVPGDTNSALGAALTGFKMDIPTCHLESGLRSFDMLMQEEINRRLIDHGSTGLFAPTRTAMMNLEREQVLGSRFLTGDTMYDILKNRLRIFSDPSFQNQEIERTGVGSEEFAVLTMHRRENVDHPGRFKAILEGISKIPHEITFPIHPRTRAKLDEMNMKIPGNVKLIAPVPYTTMMALVSRSRLLITDSGGLQKEAYLLNTPCLTVRDNTEWVETIEKGANVLAQAAADDIATKAAKMWNLELNNDPSVYGNGKASEKIARILISGEIETHRNVMTK